MRPTIHMSLNSTQIQFTFNLSSTQLFDSNSIQFHSAWFLVHPAFLTSQLNFNSISVISTQIQLNFTQLFKLRFNVDSTHFQLNSDHSIQLKFNSLSLSFCSEPLVPTQFFLTKPTCSFKLQLFFEFPSMNVDVSFNECWPKQLWENVTQLLDTSQGGSVGNSVVVVVFVLAVSYSALFQWRPTTILAWWRPLQAQGMRLCRGHCCSALPLTPLAVLLIGLRPSTWIGGSRGSEPLRLLLRPVAAVGHTVFGETLFLSQAFLQFSWFPWFCRGYIQNIGTRHEYRAIPGRHWLCCGAGVILEGHCTVQGPAGRGYFGDWRQGSEQQDRKFVPPCCLAHQPYHCQACVLGCALRDGRVGVQRCLIPSVVRVADFLRVLETHADSRKLVQLTKDF